jgi:hypothetical protein
MFSWTVIFGTCFNELIKNSSHFAQCHNFHPSYKVYFCCHNNAEISVYERMSHFIVSIKYYKEQAGQYSFSLSFWS